MALSLRLKAGKRSILQRGHPWIFSGALSPHQPLAAAGEIVTLTDEKGDAAAQGFFNPGSDIAFRLLSLDPQINIDESFWRDRLRAAAELRQSLFEPDTNAYRLVNSEGDGLPGLVVDRYADQLVATIATAGMDRLAPVIWKLLQEIIQPKSIYERSEGKARQREGLPDRAGVVWGEEPGEEMEIIESGLRFAVDLRRGQKTGFFLDQRANRQLIRSLSGGRRVLNCFSYSGGFSVHAVAGGARQVVSVEISREANALAEKNYALNGITVADHPIIQQDVFGFLRGTPEPFDLIILDPPAFAKSHKDIEKAARGYKDIQLQAMKWLKPGGLLATFSCSNHVDEHLFDQIVLGAATDAGKSLQLLNRLGPGADHPTLLAHSEGRYLKGLLLAVR